MVMSSIFGRHALNDNALDRIQHMGHQKKSSTLSKELVQHALPLNEVLSQPKFCTAYLPVVAWFE